MNKRLLPGTLGSLDNDVIVRGLVSANSYASILGGSWGLDNKRETDILYNLYCDALDYSSSLPALALQFLTEKGQEIGNGGSYILNAGILIILTGCPSGVLRSLLVLSSPLDFLSNYKKLMRAKGLGKFLRASWLYNNDVRRQQFMFQAQGDLF